MPILQFRVNNPFRNRECLAYRSRLFMVAFGVVLALIANSLVAQTLNKNKITASYLYNFAKNIEWPNEAGMGTFEMGVYGDNPQLLSELSQMADKVKIKNLPIAVSQVTSVKALAKYKLVYVDQANSKNIAEVYDALNGRPTLMITLDYTNKQLVMINLITTDNERLRFEVNKSNIINQGLKPLPELILNGGSEIDVAKLYREGQSSLVSMQKQLQVREKTLTDLSTAIQNQEATNKRLESQLAVLNQSIQKSDALIASQNQQLQHQSEQIEKNKKERESLLAEVDVRSKELDRQQQHLTQIVQTIETREKRLASLNATIRAQETEIQKQKEAITGLDQTVDSQKIALRYLWGSMALGLLLIITIFIAYNIKRRDNQRLAEHSQDLQMAKDRLAIAKRKAEDASQAKGEFLSLMSHELRTPLQAIIGYTEVVIEELKMNGDQHHINDLTRVISNSERLLKLINGVLDLAKIESGRMELDLTEIRLSSLVDEVVGIVAPLLEKNEIKLNIEVNDGTYLPSADPEKIIHVLTNLLGNASKFAPKGIVTLRALHEPSRLYLSVADTGIGLSPEQQKHIFDPFRQADSSTTRKFQGSGLGLSITRQLCELMGGTVEVESQLDKGATFIVDIPLPIEPSPSYGGTVIDADGELGAEDQSLLLAGQHVVMIDDDPAFLDIMARTLRREGYLVHTAADAEAGLRLLQTIKPQVITLDLLLPDQHGWLLFEKIKADPALKEIPVIIISMMDERKHGKRQAEEYLTKPVRRETLKLAVQRLVPPPGKE